MERSLTPSVGRIAERTEQKRNVIVLDRAAQATNRKPGDEAQLKEGSTITVELNENGTVVDLWKS